MGGSHLVVDRILVGAVTSAYVVLALLDGGYGEQTRAGMAMLVWWLFIVVTILQFRRGIGLPPAAALAAGALGLLALVTLGSTAWATDDGAAFNEGVRVAGYLGLFLLVVAASPWGARPWVTGLAVGLAAVASLALASRLLPSAFPDQTAVEFLPTTQARLSYPLNYWNGVGACMALAIVLLAWLGAEGGRRIARAAAVAAIPVAGLALFLTSSRGGVAALMVGVVVLIAAARRREAVLSGLLLAACAIALLIVLSESRDAFVNGELTTAEGEDQAGEVLVFTLLVVAATFAARFVLDGAFMRARVPRRAALAAVAGAVVLGVAGVAAGDPAERWRDFKRPPLDRPQDPEGYVVSHLARGDSNGRFQLWESAWEAFEKQPLRGIGAAGYEAWWTRTSDRYQPLRDAHSLYLETLAELGVAGFLCLLGFLLIPIVAALRLGSRLTSEGRVALAIVAAAGTSASFDWTWELPAAFVPAVVGLGVLVVEGREQSVLRSRTARLRMLGAVGIGVAAIVAALLSYSASANLSASRASFREGDLTSALDEAREARALTPWAAAPRLQLALLEERRDLARALGHIEEALERAPDDWRAWLIAARLRIRAGDLKGGRVALREARRLNPRAYFLPTAAAR